MIKLQDFVAETLKEIISGVAAAQEHAASKGARVNPEDLRGKVSQGSLWDGNGHPVQAVHFDVAIMATEGTHTKGGIGVIVGAIGLGSQGQTDKEKSLVSRIAFDVPVLLPTQK